MYTDIRLRQSTIIHTLNSNIFFIRNAAVSGAADAD